MKNKQLQEILKQYPEELTVHIMTDYLIAKKVNFVGEFEVIAEKKDGGLEKQVVIILDNHCLNDSKQTTRPYIHEK